MKKKEELFKLGFREYVHKNYLKRDQKKRLLLYSEYLNRSLVILLVEDEQEFKIEYINLDHFNEKNILKELFGDNPTVDDIISTLYSLK